MLFGTKGDVLNWPRKGLHFSDFFAVTEQYFGKTVPRKRMSSSLQKVKSSFYSCICCGMGEKRTSDDSLQIPPVEFPGTLSLPQCQTTLP